MKMHQRGFTLIELLIVIIMIGFLSLLSFKGYSEYVRYTYESKAKQEMMRMATEIQAHAVRTSSFTKIPTSKTQITINSKNRSGNGSSIPYYTITAYNLGYGIPLSQYTGDSPIDRYSIIARPTTQAISKGYSLFFMDSVGYACKSNTPAKVANSAWNCGTDSEEW